MERFTSKKGLVLPQRVLNWVSEQAGVQSSISQVTPLKGGVSSAVYALEVTRSYGESPVYWVLRQFTDQEWLTMEPDLAVHETAALLAAHSGGLRSPEWIAADYDGQKCGLPTILMSRLPGQVVLPEKPSITWIREMAGALADVHAAKIEPIDWHYYTYNTISSLRVPEWTAQPTAWMNVIERLQVGPMPVYHPRLIHRDFHPANVLWEGDQVKGIVDWVNACRGPAGIDTGHCRLNLVQLYGIDAADAFLEAYLSCYGSLKEAADPYWDMLTLIEVLPGPPGVYKGWEDLGVRGLSSDLIVSRLDEYAVNLARRILRR